MAMSENPKQNIRDVVLGQNVRLYDFINLYGCEIGDNSQVGTFVEIQNGAKVGRNVRISTHSFICEGVTIEDDVFIGHNVSFINDRFPRSKTAEKKEWKLIPTVVKRGASIGSGSTILCGVVVGEDAMVGAGSVVTKDVPPRTVVTGNPAQVLRNLNEGELDENPPGGPESAV